MTDDRQVICDMEPERCHDLLSSINDNIVTLKANSAMVEKSLLKIVYGMLGLIAASVGSKYIGTPFHTHLAIYATWFVGVFLLAALIGNWKKMEWTVRFVMGSFAGHLLFSAVCRTFVFEAGYEPAPMWYPKLIDMWYVVVSASLFLMVWKK